MSKAVNIKIGGGLCFPLLCIFMTLKLTNQIDWSWWWVTSPLWLPLVVVFGILGVIVIAGVTLALIEGKS